MPETIRNTDDLLEGLPDNTSGLITPEKIRDMVVSSYNRLDDPLLQGEQGFQGDQGDKGDQGDQGDQGDKGDQGDQGFDGPTGPQGYQGYQGNDGSQGYQGYQGNRGINWRGSYDNATTYDQFDAVQSDGSSYILAAPTGPGWLPYSPWELLAIKGDQGDQGNDGPTGPQGYQGYQGNDGSQGYQGDTGPQGDQGNTGDQGDQGYQGDTGPSAVNSGTPTDMTGVVVGDGSNLSATAGETVVLTFASSDPAHTIEMTFVNGVLTAHQVQGP